MERGGRRAPRPRYPGSRPISSSCTRSRLMVALLLLTLVGAAGTTAGRGTPWEHVGPRNIFDDEDMNGEAGTLAGAASPAANPGLIYAGGRNNGASSGVLKSTDKGRHWVKASHGLLDTRINAIFLHLGSQAAPTSSSAPAPASGRARTGGELGARERDRGVRAGHLVCAGKDRHISSALRLGLQTFPSLRWRVAINSTYGHDSPAQRGCRWQHHSSSHVPLLAQVKPALRMVAAWS